MSGADGRSRVSGIIHIAPPVSMAELAEWHDVAPDGHQRDIIIRIVESHTGTSDGEHVELVGDAIIPATFNTGEYSVNVDVQDAINMFGPERTYHGCLEYHWGNDGGDVWRVLTDGYQSIEVQPRWAPGMTRCDPITVVDDYGVTWLVCSIDHNITICDLEPDDRWSTVTALMALICRHTSSTA